MFTIQQIKRIKEIIMFRDSLPYTKEQLSWRYAIFNGDTLVGLKNITGKTVKVFDNG